MPNKYEAVRATIEKFKEPMPIKALQTFASKQVIQDKYSQPRTMHKFRLGTFFCGIART
jgi:hypothetical protein